MRCRGRFRSTSPDAVPVTHFGPSSIVASSFQLRDSFRCVAPDDPGFGLSVASPGYDFRPASHARIISQLVEGLGLNDWTLMVNDLGNDLALSPALRRLAEPPLMRSPDLLAHAGAATDRDRRSLPSSCLRRAVRFISGRRSPTMCYTASLDGSTSACSRNGPLPFGQSSSRRAAGSARRILTGPGRTPTSTMQRGRVGTCIQSAIQTARVAGLITSRARHLRLGARHQYA